MGCGTSGCGLYGNYYTMANMYIWLCLEPLSQFLVLANFYQRSIYVGTGAIHGNSIPHKLNVFTGKKDQIYKTVSEYRMPPHVE